MAIKSMAVAIREAYIIVLIITGIITAFYSALLLRLWWKMESERRKTQALNIWILVIALGFAQYFIAGHLYNMSQFPILLSSFDPLVPLLLIESAVPGGFALFIRIFKKKTPERAQYLHTVMEKQGTTARDIVRRDWKRKLTHIVQFLAIFAIDFIGFSILAALFSQGLSISYLRLEYWGVGEENYLGFSWSWNGWAVSNAYISGFRLLFFNFFYCLTFFLLTSELCRNSVSWSYMFDKIVYKNLRAREEPTIAAYALFPVGYMFACVFLPYFTVVGLLAGGCLGDLTASQVGLRWGRHQFPHQHKTWEGLIAGCLVTFLASLAFIGIGGALIFLVLFGVIDYLTEKPIPISDNLLLPISGIFAFTLATSLGISLWPIFITG